MYLMHDSFLKQLKRESLVRKNEEKNKSENAFL